ncbi:MAG: FAD-dependent oxidoreductase, partial [Candidatus Bathyarchaeales archaeon]
MKYDVVIVGAGPAGIFLALEIVEKANLRILLIDRGPDIEQRKCPASRGFGCMNCEPCGLLSGWGGAGAFSDGKLTLSTEVGGWLNQYVSEKELGELINYVDDVYIKFGAPKHVYGGDIEKVEEIERKASLTGLKLIQQKIRHMGTERCAQTLRRMRQELNGKVD